MSACVNDLGDPEGIALAIIEAGANNANALYRLVKLCGAFEQTSIWAIDGFPTAAHWIALALDVEVCTAREWIRISKKLEGLLLIDQAFANRVISYSKVRALSRFATKDNQAELLAIAQGVPAGRLNRVLAGWSLKNQNPELINNRHRAERGLFVNDDPDGAVVATLRLPPLPGKRLLAAVDARVMKDTDASTDASLAQRRADALVELVTTGPAKVDTEVVIHLRGDGAGFDDGTPIAGSIVEAIAPESFIRVLIHEADRLPINASGRHRHPTVRQKRVVKERDRHCVDCGSEEFLQYDHVPDFEQSRRTQVDELVLRCSRCHKKRHKEEKRRKGREEREENTSRQEERAKKKAS